MWGIGLTVRDCRLPTRVTKFMDRERMDAIYEKLHQLQQSETVSLFSQAFYELIAAELADEDAAAASVALAFADFLAAEVNYHRRLAVLADRDEMLVSDLQSLAEKRRVNLEAIAETVASAPASNRKVKGIQHLLLAECYYHQRKTHSVVEHLRSAIECGLDHHLIHFALGYNIYTLAVEDFTIAGDQETSLAITDQIAFQQYCLVAASALEASFSGTAFDTQIYWWMGHVLESIGMVDAARDLHSRAPNAEGDSQRDDDDAAPYLSEFDEAAKAPRYLPEISKQEIQEAGKLLRGSFSLSEVLGYDPGDQ